MPNYNVFMHRNNIFRKEPDFKKLACDYKELSQFISLNGKNKAKFDFKNPDAVRALTCTLLHRYFQKSISLPSDRLIPAVPQRLNYIRWVEDLVELVRVKQPEIRISGLDIGTGASCIFPILGCHRNPSWSFVGVEPDELSYEYAYENVNRNYLMDRIRVVKITTDDQLTDMLSLSDHPITFVMCNPPFFEEGYGITMEIDSMDLSSGLKGHRPKSSANSSDMIESVTSGGEIAFVGHMLEQSLDFKEEVIIYTSMLGKKQSLIHFKQTLTGLEEENLSWTWAELCQGKTIRYAIAWTFKPGIDLTKAPPLRHGKNKSWKFKLTRKLPKRDSQLELMENSHYIRDLIRGDLMINKFCTLKQSSRSVEFLIKTNDRRWSNQRRKRRELASQRVVSQQHQQHQISPGGGQTLLVTNRLLASSQQARTLTTDSSQEYSTTVNDTSSSLENSNDDDDDDQYDDDDTETLTRKTNNNNNHKSNRTKKAPIKSPVEPNHESSPSSSCNDEDGQQGVEFMGYKHQEEEQQSSGSRHDEPGDPRLGPECVKRLRRMENDDVDNGVGLNMDDVFDYLLCCRVSLTLNGQDVYFELKLEHPCTAANDGYNLFQYFRNKLRQR